MQLDLTCEYDSLVKKYMMGRCHALAYVLAKILDKPVGAMYAVKKDGSKIADPLHLYVEWTDGVILDVKGVRTKEIMVNDFKSLLGYLGDVKTVGYERLDSPDDIFHDLGMNPEYVEEALSDLVNGLWDMIPMENKPEPNYKIDLPDDECDESVGLW